MRPAGTLEKSSNNGQRDSLTVSSIASSAIAHVPPMKRSFAEPVVETFSFAACHIFFLRSFSYSFWKREIRAGFYRERQALRKNRQYVMSYLRRSGPYGWNIEG